MPTAPRDFLFVCRYILIAVLVAGSLDALAAIFILSHGNAAPIFRFIASGIYGKAAFAGGGGMVALGISLHYLIAFSFTILYFVIARSVTILGRNIWLSSVLYGLFIYLSMNIIVFSICNIQVAHRTIVSVSRNAVILMVCVALPVVYTQKRYATKRPR